MPTDLTYVLLLFVLFVVPRFLQRYRLPSAVTSLLLGTIASALDLFQHDSTIALLASLGIVALFLFAGLDVDLEELRPDARVLIQHLLLWFGTLVAVTLATVHLLDLPLRAGALLALALMTPSTGFILDSLHQFGLSNSEQRWTKSKAIASELLALIVMFVTLQSASWQRLGLSLLALVLLIVLLPPVFRWFAVRIAPHAPRSEFAFLLMVAVVCADATRRLGVYYLVGAFVVGLAARQFRSRLPAMSSERMLGAVEAFASFFVPFYFFKAGQELRPAEVPGGALAAGLGFAAIFVTLRLGEVVLLRWAALRESPGRSLRIGVALLPTLVFALVIGELLRERFELPDFLGGGLILYTIITTLIPGFILRVPPAPFDAPHLDKLPRPPGAELPDEDPAPSA